MDWPHYDDAAGPPLGNRIPLLPIPAYSSFQPFHLALAPPPLPASTFFPTPPLGADRRAIFVQNRPAGDALPSTHSSLTPLYRRVSERRLASSFYDLRVPSLSNCSAKTRGSFPPDSGADGGVGLSFPRGFGRREPEDAGGEQMVPVHDIDAGVREVAAGPSVSKNRNLYGSLSGESSNSWPLELRLGNGACDREGAKAPREEHGGGSCGSSCFSRTAVGDDKRQDVGTAEKGKGKEKVEDLNGPVKSTPFAADKKQPSQIPGNSSKIQLGLGLRIVDPTERIRGRHDQANLADTNKEDKDLARRPDNEGQRSKQGARRMDIDNQPGNKPEPKRTLNQDAGDKSRYRQSRSWNRKDAACAAGTPSGVKQRKIQRHGLPPQGSRGRPSTVRGDASARGDKQVQACNWLQRWLQPTSSLLADGTSKVGIAGLDPSKTNLDKLWSHQERERGKLGNRPAGLSPKESVFLVSPFLTPSASAIAMIGRNSRYFDPPLTQPKIPRMMRPSNDKVVDVKHVKLAEPGIG